LLDGPTLCRQGFTGQHLVSASEVAAQENERDPVPHVVIHAPRLVKAGALRQSLGAGEGRARWELDHHEAPTLLAEPRAGGVDEIHRHAASTSYRVDGDELNASRAARSRDIAEHNNADERASIASDDRLILIGRSREGALEGVEQRFSVWRIAEHSDGERSGGRGIRRGEGMERDGH
jgi:hypothetical protein